MACEQGELMYRYHLLEFIAKGEMPPGVTEDDLRAMELPLPSEVETVHQPDGRILVRRRRPPEEAEAAASALAADSAADAFDCDSPDGE
jgi:hypothetical protein